MRPDPSGLNKDAGDIVFEASIDYFRGSLTIQLPVGTSE
jgi:hypothetical protein